MPLWSGENAHFTALVHEAPVLIDNIVCIMMLQESNCSVTSKHKTAGSWISVVRAICEKERNALVFGSGQEFKTCTQLEKLTCKCINMDMFDRKKCLK